VNDIRQCRGKKGQFAGRSDVPGPYPSSLTFCFLIMGVFRIDEAIVRQVAALMLEANVYWVVAGRCMSLEMLARINNNMNVKLPAMAALPSADLPKGRCPYNTP
ncbi:MAG: hypothetical protein U1C74_04780, partial [Phenylobacterium sp.]|nr:hypothetical protein [Phenylobacterium sp.]